MRPRRARRRKQLAAEAEFYGAMDGASRFTQRDAVASILITSINIIAGFLIGVLQHGMELRHALETYTVLTIGDGLVTVIPALMISISGGLIVTRTGSEDSLGAEFQKQVLGTSQPLMLASGVLMVLAALPGLPTIPFLALGGGLGAVGWRMRRKSVAATAVSTAAAAKPKENLDAAVEDGTALGGGRTGPGESGGTRRGLSAVAARQRHSKATGHSARIPDAAGESEGQHRAAIARICDPVARHGDRTL